MSEPGAQPPYQPYGSNPYGSTPEYGAAPVPRTTTDPVSIVGFVLSLLCCTSVVGLILGIVGIARTKNGRRGGRWAAISAIAVGAIGTLVFVGVIGFFVWFGTSTISDLDDAEVGQCVDVDEFSGDYDATIFKKDCDEDHEAEIVVSQSFDSGLIAAFDQGGPELLCRADLGEDYTALLDSGDYEIDVVFESSEPEHGEDFVCHLQRTDGEDLDGPILD